MLGKQAGDNHMLKFVGSNRFILPILVVLILLGPAYVYAQTFTEISPSVNGTQNSN